MSMLYHCYLDFSKTTKIKRILARPILIKYFALAAIFLMAIGLLSYQIDRPYCKPWEHGELELRARNFLEEGFWKLNLLPVRNFFGGTPNYYLNHPPLAVIVLTLFMKFFGDSEFSARLSMITSALASMWLFYKIIELEVSERLALMAVFIAIFLPEYFYCGRTVSLYPFTLFVSMLTIWCFLKSISSQNVGYKLALFLSVGLGVCSDWSYYLVPPSLLIYAIFRRRRWKLALYVIFAELLAFALLMFYFNAIAGVLNGTASQLTIFGGNRYVKIAGAGRSLLTTQIFYQQIFQRMMRCFTPIIPVLALCAGVMIIFIRSQRRTMLALSALFISTGFLFPILGPTSVYYHDFGLYPFIPAAAFLSACILLKLSLVIRSLILIIFLILSFFQFHSFHTGCDPRPYQIGQAICQAATPNNNLLAPRGPPIAYYSRLPTQFLFPGPPFQKIMTCYRPTWVVFREGQENYLRTSLEQTYATLNQGGYFPVCKNGYEVWKRCESKSKEYLLEGILQPEQERSGWNRELITLGDRSVFAVCCNIDGLQNKELIFENLNIKSNSRLTGYIGFDIHNPARSQKVEFTIEIVSKDQSHILFSNEFHPECENSQVGWFPIDVDLSPYNDKKIILKFKNDLYPKNKISNLKVYWGNLHIKSL
jgi:hypothetical protein